MKGKGRVGLAEKNWESWKEIGRKIEREGGRTAATGVRILTLSHWCNKFAWFKWSDRALFCSVQFSSVLRKGTNRLLPSKLVSGYGAH